MVLLEAAESSRYTHVDVAPTIAKLLEQTLPGADGRVLTEMLTAESQR